MPYPLLLHGHHGPETVYEPFANWLVPWRMDSSKTAYNHLRSKVGLLDASLYGLIEVQGADRASFLNGLLTNDIKKLVPGEGCEAFLLHASAKLVTDLFVLAEKEALLLFCDASRAQELFDSLERYHFSESVTFENRERTLALLALQGPRTDELLFEITGTPRSFKSPCNHAKLQMGGIPVRVIRKSLAGSAGLLCACAADDAKRLWNLLRDHPSRLCEPVGWEAWNAVRIEDGVPFFGVDMDASNLLPETGLEAATVSSTKGCYIGQEVIVRIDSQGSASKRLVQLQINADTAPHAGAKVFHDQEEVGWVTSACASPATGQAAALAYVKRGASDAHKPVEVESVSGRLSARILEKGV